ncbi:MAG: plasmid replication protein RepC [Cohaesibacter sp.]|nr:plasmid replication protein RepC [Cohaesibacter sp.]
MTFSLSAPFGARPLSSEMLDGQRISAACATDLIKDKWQILRDLTDCKHLFGLSDRTLMVLSALLSFHKESDLDAQDNLIVFPSNKKLSERAHGMAEPTLRRHLAALVKAGMIVRQDSPNGKRYARSGQDGSLLKAFGFDLRLLLARAEELAQAAQSVRQEKQVIKDLRQEITLTRRVIAKCLDYALEQGGKGKWMRLIEDFVPLNKPLPRRVESRDLKELHRLLLNFSEDVHNALEIFIKAQNMSGNDQQNERHKQDSKLKTITDSEIGFPKKDHEENFQILSVPERKSCSDADYETSLQDQILWVRGETEATSDTMLKHDIAQELDLSAVLMACPDIAYCNRNGISSWADLIEAAEAGRGLMGISPSAWEDAKRTFGILSASVTLAALLQRSEDIRSPGGYLRALVARKGFSPKPMINSLLNARLEPKTKL